MEREGSVRLQEAAVTEAKAVAVPVKARRAFAS